MASNSHNASGILSNHLPAFALPALGAIGFIYLLVKVLSFVRVLLSLFVLSGKSLRTYGPRGSWALVTGASDGLGREYALQLAKQGFNILLVSRTPSKLQSLAAEIETKHASSGLQTKSLAMDFSLNLDSDYAKLQDLLQGLHIAILINNVGLSHSIPVPFLLTSPQEMHDIITVNCLATLRVTQLVAPSMVQRKRGLILTMGSFGGLLPTPLLATYSGSKAFLQQWSVALSSELAPSGVEVELVLSHLVTSAMSKIRRPSLLVPGAKAFVRSVLGSVGRSGGASAGGWAGTMTPWWSHGIMQWGLETFVGVRNGFVVGRNKVMHEDIRKRALRKRERDEKKVS
ncbi:MAG: hypothetical protein M1827_004046 [Pycnora praestabilis]|nr:MAG: hypothetical protein M1827_004046 [Pycnora praestabilis]